VELAYKPCKREPVEPVESMESIEPVEPVEPVKPVKWSLNCRAGQSFGIPEVLVFPYRCIYVTASVFSGK
jgi:hypothetical protein